MNISPVERFVIALLLFFLAGQTYAHSTAPILTTKRIASPDSLANLNTGDVLTFVIEVTPVPNGATQGAGAYITEYIPANTEVVGVRLIDRDGNTVKPNRGPQMDDGYGQRGRHNEFDSLGLLQGSLSALYADTGIFYSVDPRTARVPNNANLTVLNGIELGLSPAGASQIDNLLGFTGPPFYSHNVWDRTQVLAFGVPGGSVVINGRGNTPFGFGSPVAGPQTHYPFEVVESPACSDGINNDGDAGTDYPGDPECSSALDNDETAVSDAPVGPWQRISYWGSELGTGSATDCANCASDYVRVGVPTNLGWSLSADNPLPANTNAVRFALGELIAGERYFAEISLRVTALPIDPVMGADVNCAEVFGGDAAMPQNGRDNAWRYFLPSPACVQLDMFFDLEADRQTAALGDTITYTLHVRNTTGSTQTNVAISDSFESVNVVFQSMLQGPDPALTAGLLSWPVISLEPGQDYILRWQMQVIGNSGVTTSQADYTSDAFPAPGPSDSVLTTIEPLVLLAQQAMVTPPGVSAGADVRYRVTVTNIGTSQAETDASSGIEVSLPTGFTYCSSPACPAPTINAGVVADPAINGSALAFTSGLQAIAANGGSLVLEFSVLVGGGVLAGQYDIDVSSRFDDLGIGKNVEVSSFGLAPLLVDILRSEPPEIDIPFAGMTSITGWTVEGAGSTIRVFVNGTPVPPVLADLDGRFAAPVPTLYSGQRISASAQAGGKLESTRAAPEVSVLGQNNPPVITVNTGLTVVEGNGSVLTDAMLKTVDDTSPAEQIFYSVSIPPASGVLSLSSFTQADINNGLLSYQHDGTAGSSDVFYFDVSDNLSTLTTNAFTITIRKNLVFSDSFEN